MKERTKISRVKEFSNIMKNFVITPTIVAHLDRIENIYERVISMPLEQEILTRLRESARLYSTHYSTMIEGNRLRPDQIARVLNNNEHFPGKERDEEEVKGYYTALNYVDSLVKKKTVVSERTIQMIHALTMAHGTSNVKPTAYRVGQNVIRDGFTHAIIYLPPEAADVPKLMKGLVAWIKRSSIPVPLIAGVAHYQFATIHPYYDGNGRTARLLATWLMHAGGYLKGLYVLEEYYARNLGDYYEAIAIGPSHNYYEGRAKADITPWVEYFIEGAVSAFERVMERVEHAKEE
jgi:Fic family protein